ncbi:MAG: RDD family protein [Desulfobacter sp.]|nr:RDD family protein [Desulfobacter sp.]
MDSVFLGIFGLVLGLFFSQQFVGLGVWGRGIGFPIAVVYFAIFNSRMGGGQTLGKRILKIQVVDKTGEFLDLPQSTLRYFVIGLPYFLNGAIIPESFLYPVGVYLLSVLVFGFGLCILYLIIFNRNTRQSLHDMIAGTYVVLKNTQSVKPLRPVGSVHYAVCGIIMVAALLAPIFIGQMSQNEFFSELTWTRDQIQGLPQVVYATIHDGHSTFRPMGGESKTTTYINTRVLIKQENIEDEKLAFKIANTILQTHKEANQRNLIQVVLTHGYDIGIASRWNSYQYSFAPEDWLAKKE